MRRVEEFPPPFVNSLSQPKLCAQMRGRTLSLSPPPSLSLSLSLSHIQLVHVVASPSTNHGTPLMNECICVHTHSPPPSYKQPRGPGEISKNGPKNGSRFKMGKAPHHSVSLNPISKANRRTFKEQELSLENTKTKVISGQSLYRQSRIEKRFVRQRAEKNKHRRTDSAEPIVRSYYSLNCENLSQARAKHGNRNAAAGP